VRGVAAFACAHRGLSAEFPENTLAAFQGASEVGFRAVEMDLRVTADGEVVVLHDAGIERTTDGNGRVADMRYDDLRRHPTPAGPVPRLDDVLAALSGWPGLWNLEIKADKATLPALELAAHRGTLDRTQVSSMDPRVLEAVRDEWPGVSRGLIALGPLDEDILDLSRELGCRWVNADHEFMAKPAVRAFRKAGLHVAAWTVNDPGRALELASWGVECVITDVRDVLHGLADQAPATPAF
jgi:glycerophosphoryl diester phosphodiesterase